MGKLSEKFKNMWQKIKELSTGKKIAYGLLCISVLAVLIYGVYSLTATKYDVLFSNMDSADQGAVISKLKEKKVSVQYKGNSILVPKDQVDQLRMELMSEVQMTSGSQGFELLDKSKFGSTDAEMKINYQRALQGELERTIKGFPQIENARVHLVMPEDTVFNKDVTPGSASVTLVLKQGQKLSDDQVKGIISLVSGSVRNIPKEGVEVIDDKMTVLSKDLFNNGDNTDSTTSAEKQQDLKKKYESEAQTKVLNMLEAIYGKGKVKVTVNADLNFDAIQNQKTTYDPKGTVVSEHNVYGATAGTPAANSMSPVDNNMQATVQNDTTQNQGMVNKEETKNYNITKSEDKIIKAPGEVKRLTTSVVIDGNLNEQTKASVNNLVISAVGYDKDRGDIITVEGLRFDTTIADKQSKEIEDLKKLAAEEKKYKLYKTIGIAAGSGILLLIMLIALRKKKNNNEEELALEEAGIDVLIDDDNNTNEPVKFKPIEFEVENERTHFENEIKKYASEKPEQVADIIKSWLAEDER